MQAIFNIYNLNILLIYVGYIWVNILSLYFPNLDFLFSQYRFFHLILSLYLIISRYNLFLYNLKKHFIFLILFSLIYSIRLIYDHNYITEISTSIEHLQQFLVIGIIPSLAIITTKIEDIENIDKTIKWFFLFSLLISLPILGNYSGEELGRIGINENVNSLYLGQFSVSFILLSVFHFFSNKKYKLLNILFIFYGLIMMGIASARSPIISLAISILIYTVSIFKLKKAFKIIIFIIGSAYILFEYYNALISKYGSSFIDRLSLSIIDGDSSGRVPILIDAFNQFISNPLFGSAHFILNQLKVGRYPHNLFLESFMALGIGGGFIFIILIYKGFKSGYNLMKNESNNLKYSWVFLLFIQYLSFGMFSGSLYSSYYFWGSLVLCIHTRNIIK